jgi:hypothetical protein
MNKSSILTEGEFRKKQEEYKGKLKVADMKNYRDDNEKQSEKPSAEKSKKTEEGKGLDYWAIRAINEETLGNINFEQTVVYTKLLGLPLPKKEKQEEE